MATKRKAAKKTDSVEMISREKAAKYHVSDTRTPSGRKSVDNDDAVAKMTRGKTPAELKALAKEHGFADKFKIWSDTLNPGQVKMAVNNKLRALRRGPKVKKAKKSA